MLAAAVVACGLVGVPAAQAAGGNPVEKTNGFYVDPDSNPNTWYDRNKSDSRAAKIKANIADKPGARWFGDWSRDSQGEADIYQAVDEFTWAADVADKLPVLVAYNIPHRDCGSHSGGGAQDQERYKAWITDFAKGIGGKPAVVVIEPDALAQLDCFTQDRDKQIRKDLLRYAALQFKTYAPNTWAYMDGGNSTWIPAAEMAKRLNDVGVTDIRGFAVNVSNFKYTSDSNTYGQAVNTELKKFGYSKTWVVDTSRNGSGPLKEEYCNPAGRKLGVPSQLGGGAEMLLWVKVPGDSDGSCGMGAGIPAGTFDPGLAVRLIDGR